jgi:hypothetical protein
MEARMSHMDRYLLGLLFLAAAMATAATNAHAVITQRLKDACRAEYLAYCGAHELGGEGLRTCMRAAQDKLSQLKELVASGEVTQAEIKAYNGRKRN